MKEKTKREKRSATDQNPLDSELLGKAEVQRRIRSPGRYRFPWLLIVTMLIVFIIVFVIATYFSGSG